MSTIIDSYSETNQDNDFGLHSGSNIYVGQSFISSVSAVLDSAKFFLKKQAGATGNATIKIYAATGSGSNITPTGSALATSDNFDVSTLLTTYGLATFIFSGGARITLTPGTTYCAIVFYNGATMISLGFNDTGSPTHSGNQIYSSDGSSWNADSGHFSCFYVYGILTNYTLTYNVGSNGSIAGSNPQTVAYGGNGSQVTATPNIGYHFTSWSDGVLTAARTDTNITANLTVTANFAINTFTLTYIAGTGGVISGTTPQTVNYGANGSSVTANPINSHYTFSSWSDGVVTATRQDLNIIGNISVTANFIFNPYSYQTKNQNNYNQQSNHTANYSYQNKN